MRTNLMKKIIAVACALVLMGAGAGLALNRTAVAENTVVVTSPFTEAISQVRDSVVGIRNYQNVRYSNSGLWGFYGFGYGDDYGRDRGQSQEVLSATGSGVVIAEHYVLTNFHVVENASTIKVTVANPDKTEPDLYDAEVVTYDENLDVAIVYAPKLDLPAVKLGDSDSLQVGDWAICIGNPMGETFSGTVTTGVISGLNRAMSSTSYDRYGRRETVTNSMIQVDAAINSGNSGGGMFSVTGELMGIPTLKYTGSVFSGTVAEGIGLCVPINAAKPLIEDVLSGKIETPEVNTASSSSDNNGSTANNGLEGKPRLGIKISSINPNSTIYISGLIPNGVYVSEVEENGPAAAAGMEAADIIVDVDGTVITGVTQIQSIIAEHKEGDTLKIKVFRLPGLADATDASQLGEGSYVDLEVKLAVVDAVAQ